MVHHILAPFHNIYLNTHDYSLSIIHFHTLIHNYSLSIIHFPPLYYLNQTLYCYISNL